MPDSYQLPAVVMTALLLPVFAYLYLRSRDARTILWLLGFFCAILRMLQVYQLGLWDFSDPALHPWIATTGQIAALVGANALPFLPLAALLPYR